MSTIRYYNKKTQTTYVYSSRKEWSSEKQAFVTVRKLLGKVDPKTGEVIPTGPRGRPRKDHSLEEREKEDERIHELEALVEELKLEVYRLTEERETIIRLLEGLSEYSKQAKSILEKMR